MNTKPQTELGEYVRKRVGGSLSHLDPLVRLEALRRNARALSGDVRPLVEDGTRIRKVVGRTR
jgi:hypothetical protein